MAASQLHVDGSTPMGARLIPGGATFRVWAPGAEHVYVALDGAENFLPESQFELVRQSGGGDWTGYFPGVGDGTKYRFFVVGPGDAGFKRDPWARELELYGYPNCDCIVRALDSYPWHDKDFRTPAFEDLIVYQFHVGVFYAKDGHGRDLRPGRVSKLLDAIDRVAYLADLGVTAIQPLPLAEFQGEWSLGYNGTDLFSPEMDYCVDPRDLPPYLEKINALLVAKEKDPLSLSQLDGQVNQVKAFVDIFHVYGIAVIADVVYNHAGGNLDGQSLDYFDFPAEPGPLNNLYFTGAEWAGGRVFAFNRPGVQKYLIGNAAMLLQEFHVDGLRFDEVSVIDSHEGWAFCQELTRQLRSLKADAVLIAEYWGEYRWLAVLPPPEGMGFGIGYSDGIRDGVRRMLAQAAGGASASIDLDKLRGLDSSPNQAPWQIYNCLENHDLVLDSDGDHRYPRIARLADPTDSRSWYARSRARVATGLLLSAPGTPMLFMGQEFLEDKLWSDNPNRQELLIWWDGLERADKSMSDMHSFTRDLLRARRRHPALRRGSTNVVTRDHTNRVLAFHRWIPDADRDVVVVMTLSENAFPFGSYALGFPSPGHWHEVINSDYYEGLPNAQVQGNGGHVIADGPPMHGFGSSAGVTLPANGLLIFARDLGD